jgi:thiol-disulfide isomerase/thioredoxin
MSTEKPLDDLRDQSKMRKNIELSFRVLLSFMFLLSAVAKLYPSPHFALTTFEIKQLLPMGFSEVTAAYFSRTLIGCELALGILLMQPNYYRRLVLPMSFLILFIFSAHLTYEIISTGNKGNCGCFGALLPMTPLQAVIKNIIGMGMIAYLFKITEKHRDKMNFNFVTTITFASILLIYMVGPMRQITTAVEDTEQEMAEEEMLEDELSEDTLVVEPSTTAQPIATADAKTQPEEKPVVEEPKKKKSGYKTWFADIDKGRKILCFFAPGCDHCKETAKELTQLKKQIPDFPEVKIVFMDEEAELIPDFFTYAGAKYPYQIADVASFWQSLGGTKDTPGVIYLWNGNVIKEYDGINEKQFKMNEFKGIVTKAYKDLK